MNLDSQSVRHEAHHTGAFYPGNLLKLSFSLGQWNEEDIAPDVSTEHFHDLWRVTLCSPAISMSSLELMRKRHECLP